jgi:uncharacterized membrane protein
MSRKRRRTRITPSRPSGWIRLARLLIAAAMAGSMYLAWAALSSQSMPGCGPESGCDEVLNSRWARLFGIPVSLGALLVYGTLAAATIGFSPNTSPTIQKRVRALAFFAAMLTLIAALWFIGVQLLAVRAFCPYCTIVHACGSAASLLILVKLPLVAPRHRARQPQVETLLSHAAAVRLILAATLAVALLGLGQSVHQPESLVSRAVSGASAPQIAPAAEPTRSDREIPDQSSFHHDQTPPATTSRTLRLHGDTFEFNLDEVPLIGPADAPHVVVNLFDYTCRHCRVLHGFLMEAQQTFTGLLAIVSLPAPLDPDCNSLVPRHLPDHTNACTYARIGLAVGRADPAQREAFDAWMFAPQRPPTPDEARERAIALVGSEAFAHATNDPWIDRQLERYTRLYALNYHHSRISRLPQLMIGTNIVAGDFRRVEQLYHLLATHLDLHTPATKAR